MTFAQLIILLVVLFVISLSGAVVLFKYLKSSAVIRKSSYQAGGAIAGFLLIFSLFSGIFYSWLKFQAEDKPKGYEEWTLKGVVKKKGSQIHDGIIAKFQPPSPHTMSDANGEFRLDDILVIPGKEKERNPEIQLRCQGYFPKSIELYDTSKVERIAEGKLFRLKDTVKLRSLDDIN